MKIQFKVHWNFSIFYGKDQNLLDHSQISWDFVTEIVEIFQKMIFQKLEKRYTKLELEENRF